MKKRIAFYSLIIVFLTFTFIFSFVPKKKSGQILKTSLTDSLPFEQVAFLQIVMDGTELILENNSGVWWVYDGDGRVPANAGRIESFWNELCKVREYDIIKASGSESMFQNNFVINWFDVQGRSGDVVFGETDFSGMSRLLKKENSILMVKDFPETYLNTSFQFWCEGEVLSKYYISKKAEDVQAVYIDGVKLDSTSALDCSSKLFSSRYSNVIAFDESSFDKSSAISTIKLVFGDKSEITLYGIEIGSELNKGIVVDAGVKWGCSVSNWTFNYMFMKS